MALFVATAPIDPANVELVPVALVSVTALTPELMIFPPVPGSALLFAIRSTIWFVPFRSKVPPFTNRLSTVGMFPVGCTRIVLFPPFSLSTPPLIVVPLFPTEPV